MSERTQKWLAELLKAVLVAVVALLADEQAGQPVVELLQGAPLALGALAGLGAALPLRRFALSSKPQAAPRSVRAKRSGSGKKLPPPPASNPASET